MKVRLHIERLVLDGLQVSSADAARLKVAMEAELGRLLAEGGMNAELAAGGALPHVSTAAMRAASGSEPAELGRAIARSIHSGIGQP
jgi:hypothetical protein